MDKYYLFDRTTHEFICIMQGKSAVGIWTTTKKRKEAYEFPTEQAAKDVLKTLKDFSSSNMWDGINVVVCHQIGEENKNNASADLLQACRNMLAEFAHLTATGGTCVPSLRAVEDMQAAVNKADGRED